MFDAIYARQSVEKTDSISVESQVELCRRELTDAQARIYTDKGYSGKNVDRPAFQQLLQDVRTGLIRRVIVYRLDRISRSVVDFARIISLLEEMNVSFVSTAEKFDTRTPAGRAMLMLVMTFAQLERETIQQRITDAYRSRSRRGFYMGGRIPYGFRLACIQQEGVSTKKYEAVPEEAAVVRQIYARYAVADCSLSELASALEKQGITKRNGTPFSRGRLRELIVNPIYAVADESLYDFFRSCGAELVNAREAYNGSFSAYRFQALHGAGERPMAGEVLVLAPHRGLVGSAEWIACRKKCMGNRGDTNKKKKNWLAGVLHCADCGALLTLKSYPCKTKADRRYFLCSGKGTGDPCGFSSLDAELVEWAVQNELKKRLLLLMQQEDGVLRRQEELRKRRQALLEKLPFADTALMQFLNQEAERLEDELRFLDQGSRPAQSRAETKRLEETIQSVWTALCVEKKNHVAKLLIHDIKGSESRLDILWNY